MKLARIPILALSACGLMVSIAEAQRGVGDPMGIARQGVRPAIVALAGEVLEVKIGPCENTTGPSLLGAHLFLETEAGETLNIHLGPTARLAFLADELSAGDQVEVEGFRTEKMEEGHYVAQSLSYGKRTVNLRDEVLRPMWSGGRGAARWGQGGPAWYDGAMGRGPGAGYGYRGGRGPGGNGRRGGGPGWGWCPGVWR